MTARTALETLTLARDYLDLIQSIPGAPTSTLLNALYATAPAIRELLNDDILWLTGMRVTSTLHEQIAAALLSTPHAELWLTDRASDLGDEVEREQFARDHMFDIDEEATQ